MLEYIVITSYSVVRVYQYIILIYYTPRDTSDLCTPKLVYICTQNKLYTRRYIYNTMKMIFCPSQHTIGYMTAAFYHNLP